MSTLKVGDRIRCTDKRAENFGKQGVVRSVNQNAQDTNIYGERCIFAVKYDDGATGSGDGNGYQFVGPVTVVLHYQLVREAFEAFETFATMKEAQNRITELAKLTNLDRETIKVYEVAKTYDVKLETRIVFGTKVKLSAAKKARSKKGKN